MCVHVETKANSFHGNSGKIQKASYSGKPYFKQKIFNIRNCSEEILINSFAFATTSWKIKVFPCFFGFIQQLREIWGLAQYATLRWQICTKLVSKFKKTSACNFQTIRFCWYMNIFSMLYSFRSNILRENRKICLSFIIHWTLCCFVPSYPSAFLNYTWDLQITWMMGFQW